MKTCIILRGVSGSGKSTFAEYLAVLNDAIICCADDYFIDQNGNYQFDATKLKKAHEYCYNLFYNNILNDKNVIVSNTNAAEWEFSRYKNMAEKHNYKIFVLIVENHHNNKNIHNVPENILNNQKEKLLKSIKL